MLCTTKFVGFKPSVLSLCFVLLSACSSGGSKNKNNPPPPADTTPDEFTLSVIDGIDPTKAALNTAITLKPIKINGITAPASISITGGAYSINGATPTNVAGTVTNDQTITITTQTKTKTSQVQTVVLTVGGLSKNITITTLPDTTPPVVVVDFPPANTMTESNTLFLRGTIEDKDGTLRTTQTLKVGDAWVTVKPNPNNVGDQGTWEATVNLTEGRNSVNVVGYNQANKENTPVVINTKKVPAIATESFPNETNPILRLSKGYLATIEGKKVLIAPNVTELNPVVYAIDTTTGERTIFTDNQGFEEGLHLKRPSKVHMYDNKKLYIYDAEVKVIFEQNLNTGERKIIAQKKEGSNLDFVRSMYYEEKDGAQTLYVLVNKVLFSIDLLSPVFAQTLLAKISDDTMESFEWQAGKFIVAVTNGAASNERSRVDEINKTDGTVKKLFSFNSLNSNSFAFADVVENNGTIYGLNGIVSSNGIIKDRGIFSVKRSDITSATDFKETNVSPMLNGQGNIYIDADGMVMDKEHQYFMVLDDGAAAIIAIDAISGHRVVLSKSYTPPPVTE